MWAEGEKKNNYDALLTDHWGRQTYKKGAKVEGRAELEEEGKLMYLKRNDSR